MMHLITPVLPAAAVMLAALYAVARLRKVIFVFNGKIIVRGLFRKVILIPADLKSISRTTDLRSRIFRLSLVVVETRDDIFTVYTRRVTDKRWQAFLEELR